MTYRDATRCYNKLWKTERWPEVWKKGLLVKIFKKGDLRDLTTGDRGLIATHHQ